MAPSQRVTAMAMEPSAMEFIIITAESVKRSWVCEPEAESLSTAQQATTKVVLTLTWDIDRQRVCQWIVGKLQARWQLWNLKFATLKSHAAEFYCFARRIHTKPRLWDMVQQFALHLARNLPLPITICPNQTFTFTCFVLVDSLKPQVMLINSSSFKCNVIGHWHRPGRFKNQTQLRRLRSTQETPRGDHCSSIILFTCCSLTLLLIFILLVLLVLLVLFFIIS